MAYFAALAALPQYNPDIRDQFLALTAIWKTLISAAVICLAWPLVPKEVDEEERKLGKFRNWTVRICYSLSIAALLV